jgi:hypothetical protein
MRFTYGALTLCGGTFQNPSATQQLCNSVESLVTLPFGPTTPHRQRHQALTPARFRLFPFRSPLLRESLLLSFPQGTEMFQFPWFPLPALCVQAGVPPFFAVVGFPIRISTDQCSVDSSPWLIAVTRVLHRLQAPRHPPLAFVAWRTRCSCSLCNSQRALEAPANKSGAPGGLRPTPRKCVTKRGRFPHPGPREVSPENGTEVARLLPCRDLEVNTYDRKDSAETE